MTTSNNNYNNDPISIYIHRAHSVCDDPDVFRNTFNRVLGADCVRSVDLVKKTDQNQVPFIRAFVHFNFWPRNETADRMHYELISDKRIEVTYNQETGWFWRFCRSKLLARDDPKNALHRRNNRKPRYEDEDKNAITTKEDTGVDDVPSYPVLQRSYSKGYKETSMRNVSNRPAWMSKNQGNTNCSVIVETNDTMSLSDDGECDMV
jgi:hypothetical protein